MKLKKEDQSVDISFLLRMGNKVPMGGVTETKFRAEMEGRTMQRLPHLGIHSINTQNIFIDAKCMLKLLCIFSVVC